MTVVIYATCAAEAERLVILSVDPLILKSSVEIPVRGFWCRETRNKLSYGPVHPRFLGELGGMTTELPDLIPGYTCSVATTMISNGAAGRVTCAGRCFPLAG